MNNNLITKSSPEALLSNIKVAPNSVAARVILAFLTTAGIFYINIMPALVSGLKEGLDYTNQQAGFVSSANLYGASIGALAAVFLIKRINWKQWSYALLVILIVLELSCIVIINAELMIAVRALHGLLGGLLVGIGFGIISRTAEADKTFGYLLFIQWGLGGLGIMYLPGLVPDYGTAALFVSLALFATITLVIMPFLPDYEVNNEQSQDKQNQTASLKPLLLTLLAIFLFQGANMGLFAYMIALGKAEGLTTEFMSQSLGLASWVAIAGAFVVMVIGTKFGRVIPLTIGILITALCSWVLNFSEQPNVYLYANIVIGVTWAFVLPYLFGICSELDKAGQYAALGGFSSKVGLATGPMVAAILVGESNYPLIINIAVVTLIICTCVAIFPAHSLSKR